MGTRGNDADNSKDSIFKTICIVFKRTWVLLLNHYFSSVSPVFLYNMALRIGGKQLLSSN